MRGPTPVLLKFSDIGLSCDLTFSFIELGLRDVDGADYAELGVCVVSLGSLQDQHTSLQLEELEAKVARKVG